MSSSIQICESWSVPQTETSVWAESQWYAIHTRSQHEKSVAARLETQGITAFLPLVIEERRWSDRRKLVHLPLFPCYAFVNIPWHSEARGKIAHTDGVLGFVGFCGGGIPIPDIEIECIRKLLSGKIPYTSYPFLKIGQRVRVRGGSLDGVEGIFLARKGNNMLVISIEPIQRSLAININGYSVEPI